MPRLFPLWTVSILTTLIASPASAAILLTTAIQGVSNQIPATFVQGTPLKIYGGFAGPMTAGNCPTVNNGTVTCNNCEVGVDPLIFNPCNQRRAYPDLRVVFTFTSTSLPQGALQISPRFELVPAGVSATGQPVTFTSTPTTVTGPNQPVIVSVRWQDICQAYDIDLTANPDDDPTTCDIARASAAFRMGFDVNADGNLNGEEVLTVQIDVSNGGGADFAVNATTKATCLVGLCDFNLTAGDEKATVRDPLFKTGGGLPAAFALLFCQTDAFDNITQLDICAELPVSGTTLVEDEINGLPNGVERFFHGGIKDEANNIGGFSKLGDNECPADQPNCRRVTPDEVIGLFKDEQNCFIATAAYGSPMEKNVKLLRQFRNRFLLTNSLGRAFVKLYYAVSPPVARWIAENPNRRETTRMILAPVVWSVSVFMNWSWTLGLALLFGCGLLAFRRKFYKA